MIFILWRGVLLVSCLVGVVQSGTLWGCFEFVGLFWRAGTLLLFRQCFYMLFVFRGIAWLYENINMGQVKILNPFSGMQNSQHKVTELALGNLIWNGQHRITIPLGGVSNSLPTWLGNAYFSMRCRIKNPYFFDIFLVLSKFQHLLRYHILLIRYLYISGL